VPPKRSARIREQRTPFGGPDADYFSGGGGTDTLIEFAAPDLWDGT
jgi:hypothetical protein